MVKKDTQEKILSAAKLMGYRANSLASNLRSKRSKTVGVLVPRLNSDFMADVIAGMEKVLNKAGYNLIISQSLETMQKEIVNAETMINNRIDGLLVSLASDTNLLDHFEVLIKKGVPVIFFDRVIENNQWPNIKIDNYQAAYQVTQHLISQGCKDIIHLGGNLLRNIYSERFRGYKQALLDNKISFKGSNMLLTDLSVNAGVDAADYILNRERLPDGVFAANDQCAISCMQVLKKNGIKVPHQVAFAGFNNDVASKVVEPNLTTVDYNGHEMGEVAAQVLISHLSNGADIKITRSIVLRSDLIIRGSSLRNNNNY